MKGFRWAGDLNGQKNPMVKRCYVPDATAIEMGEPVRYTQGTGIVVLDDPTNLLDGIYGVSMTEKAANDGTTWIDVSISPTALYKYDCRSHVYTLTGGSTTTAVDSSLLPATNDIWIGGKIEIISCAADSSLNGRRVSISDSTGSSGTLTLGETLPAALAAGDTIYICPGYMMESHQATGIGYDLDATAMELDFDADGSAVTRIFSTNPDTMEIVVTFLPWEPNT